MRKFIIAATMAAAVSVSSPAFSQGWRLSPTANTEIRQDIDQLERQISRAQQRGTISRREAVTLRRQAAEIRRLASQFRQDGLSRSEVMTLERQVNMVRVKLRLARRDWDGRRS